MQEQKASFAYNFYKTQNIYVSILYGSLMPDLLRVFIYQYLPFSVNTADNSCLQQ